MVKGWPHSGTLTYLADGSYDSDGVYTAGESTELPITKCNIQPNTKPSYVIGDGGVKIDVNYKVYMPRFENDDTIDQDGMQFSFNGKSYLVLEFWIYQKRVRIKC